MNSLTSCCYESGIDGSLHMSSRPGQNVAPSHQLSWLHAALHAKGILHTFKVAGLLSLTEWALLHPGRFWTPSKPECVVVMRNLAFLQQMSAIDKEEKKLLTNVRRLTSPPCLLKVLECIER